jgi:hypothetical protein
MVWRAEPRPSRAPKLGCRDRAQLVTVAYEGGLVIPERRLSAARDPAKLRIT